MRLFVSSVLFIGSLLAASPSSAQTLFVLGGGQIVEADTTLAPPIPRVNSAGGSMVTVDAAAGFIFWMNGLATMRANLDGSGVTTLISAPASLPQLMCVNEIQSRVYWADPGVLQIRSIGYTGASPDAAGGFPFVNGLTIDAPNDKVYMTIDGPNVIASYDANLGSETLVLGGLSDPSDVCVDRFNQNLYFANGSGQLQRCTVTGGGLTTLGSVAPNGGAVLRIQTDGEAGWVYVATSNAITRYAMVGTTAELVYSGAVSDFALVPAPPLPPEPTFVRGDCNADATKNIADAIFLLTGLFGGGDLGSCDDACDMNDDGLLNIADAVAGLNALFGGGVTPAPTDACGLDPTDADPLDCVAHAGCP